MAIDGGGTAAPGGLTLSQLPGTDVSDGSDMSDGGTALEKATREASAVQQAVSEALAAGDTASAPRLAARLEACLDVLARSHAAVPSPLAARPLAGHVSGFHSSTASTGLG